MAVLYINSPYPTEKTSFGTIVRTGICPGYGLTEAMADLPSGTLVEVICRRRKQRAVGKLNRGQKTGRRAANRDRYDVYIDGLEVAPYENPDSFDRFGLLLK